MDKDSVLDKIRKLLRLQYSAEKVGNAGEAFQAAKMVRKLLFEYNLSMNDVNDGDSKESQNVTESDGISMSDQYSIHWKRRLLGIICQYNLCELLYQPRHKEMIKSYYRQKDYKIGKGRNSRIEVIGSAYDVGFSDGRNVSLDRQLRQEKTSRTAIA